MSNEELIRSIDGVTEPTEQYGILDDDYWIVQGKLRTYFVHKPTNNVYTDKVKYISVMQPPHGHTLHDTLAVIMALKNDDVMSEYITTLK